MDPLLKVSSDIYELIFQHFNSIDVKILSSISPNWYREIGNSKCCMNKVRMSMKFWRSTAKHEQTELKIKILQNISRRYQHLKIDCRFNQHLSNEFWNLLIYLAPHVKTLKIKSIKLENPKKIELQKLEELKLVYVPIDIRNQLITSSCALRYIKLKLVSPLNWNNKTSKTDPESLDCIRKCLETNVFLKEIEIYGAVQYSLFFDEDVSHLIKFNLNALKIKNDMRLTLIPERIEQILINFLATQSATLTSIFIDVCRPKVIQQIFNGMKSLTSIHIETVVNDFRIRDLKFKLNERVTDLKIPYVTRNDDIREILQVTPNVRSLFVAHLSHETTTYIAWNLRNLIHLKYRYDEIDSETLYERLKNENPQVNQNIDMIIDYDYY